MSVAFLLQQVARQNFLACLVQAYPIESISFTFLVQAVRMDFATSYKIGEWLYSM